MFGWRQRGILIVLLVGGYACGPSPHYETLAEDAERFCEMIVDCNSVADPEDYRARCENDKVDQGNVALGEGEKCANSYADVLACLSFLSCNEYEWDWGINYSTSNAQNAYPCKDETVSFLDHCEMAWFAKGG